MTYDLEAIAAVTTRATVSGGPPSMWRYASLLPRPHGPSVDLGAGFTRLRPAPRLAAELGLRKLWIKNDGANPTHSFKDRVVSVALTAARSLGFEVAACASTGNLANAVAAHAAAAGMHSVVFVPLGLEAGKLAATTVYGGDVIAVEGSYDDANRLCAELLATRPWAFVNINMRPFYSEGSKTVAFEIAEQLGWRAPDAIVVPVAAGSLLTKVAKGFRELSAINLLDEEPAVAIFGAQAAGCAPVARAFAGGATQVLPVKPDTVARSLAIGDPADGVYALEEVRRSGGAVEAVPEEAVATGIRLLARTEGLFAESAGGVAIAALEQMVAGGAISPQDETVVLMTGVGLKTIEALGPAVDVPVVRPVVGDVDGLLERAERRSGRGAVVDVAQERAPSPARA
ncbi:MAG: threonine synthase [Actinomycetota bacterium]